MYIKFSRNPFFDPTGASAFLLQISDIMDIFAVGAFAKWPSKTS